MFYETCEYITFADKLKMLRWRDYAGIQEAPYNDREEGGWREGKRYFIASGDGRRSHKQRNIGTL